MNEVNQKMAVNSSGSDSDEFANPFWVFQKCGVKGYGLDEMKVPN